MRSRYGKLEVLLAWLQKHMANFIFELVSIFYSFIQIGFQVKFEHVILPFKDILQSGVLHSLLG